MPKLTDADAINEIIFGPRKSLEPETAGFDMNDLAVIGEWTRLEHAISDLVERFPGGRGNRKLVALRGR